MPLREGLVKLPQIITCSSPEPKANKVRFIGWESNRHPSVCMCVNTFKCKYLRNQRPDCNKSLSEASLGRGKAALGFGPERIGALVSMATDNSHRVKMGKYR